MTWTAIQPDKTPRHQESAVTLKITPPTRRNARRLVISLRPGGLPKLTWIGVGKAASVAIGTGEHRGYLRVAPNGPFAFSRVGPHGGKVLSLYLPLPAEIQVDQETNRISAEFSIDGSAIQIKLPAWQTVEATVPARGADAKGIPFRTEATRGRALTDMVARR